MSKSLRGRLLAAIFSAGAAAALAAPAGAETLSDALAAAYDTNPSLLAQRAAQRALDETYVQARSGWRPQLSLGLQALYQEVRTPQAARTSIFSPPSISESNQADAQLSFSQPLWTGGRVAAAVSAAESDVMQGRENLRRVEAQVMSQVIQAYVDVRRDEQSLIIQQTNVQVLQDQLKESQARFDVGEITRTDVAQSQSRLAASQALLQSSTAQLAISRANYASAVGHNPASLAPEPSLAYLLPATVDEAFMTAEANNAGLRAQEYAEQASRARVAGARAERLPNVALRAGVTTLGPADPFDRGLFDREVTASAVVTVPLFNGGLTTSRIRQAIERNNTDRITIETQRRTVLQGVTQTWNQLLAARANITSTAEQVRAARIAAEGTKREQEVGLRTTLDVLNAEQELRQAELSQVQSQHDEYVAASGVIAAMGRLEAKNLIPSMPQYDAKANFRKLRITWGWVPWEEPIAVLDRVVALPPTSQPKELPAEKPLPPGLQPPPVVAPAAAPPAARR